VVSFLFLFTWWQFCIVQILSGPKTFLYISFSSDVWSGIFFLFFCFFPLLWLGIFFLFCFLSLFDWEFSPFALFSFEGKVYGELGLWLKACRTDGHDIRQSVGLVSGSGIKGMSHIISMTHMQQWWLGNFMQNWSCMHPCGHSSIKFLWSCDTRAQDSFSLFKSTQCFQNMFFYQFMHSSESILGVRENFHSIHPSGVYTFFSKTGYDQWIFFKEKLEVYSFQKHVGFSVERYMFCSCLFLFFFSWGILLPKHMYIFVRYFCYIHAYPRYLAT